MKKKLITALVLVGILAMGSTIVAFAASNQKVKANSTNDAQEEQSVENKDDDINLANTKTAITQEQATQIALDSVKGSTLNTIKLEDENGTIVFGVEIKSGATSFDVKVDANTGAILKSDQDNDQNENDAEKASEKQDNDNIEHENQNEDPQGYED